MWLWKDEVGENLGVVSSVETLFRHKRFFHFIFVCVRVYVFFASPPYFFVLCPLRSYSPPALPFVCSSLFFPLKIPFAFRKLKIPFSFNLSVFHFLFHLHFSFFSWIFSLSFSHVWWWGSSSRALRSMKLPLHCYCY